MQCNYADDVNGFILAKLGADQISVLKDLTKYDNILMKSPIANCQTLTLMTSSSSNIPTLTC